MSSRPVNKSAYELMREDNIREREAMFESLNIEQDVTSVQEGLPAKTSRRGRSTKRKVVDPPLSPRKLRIRK